MLVKPSTNFFCCGCFVIVTGSQYVALLGLELALCRANWPETHRDLSAVTECWGEGCAPPHLDLYNETSITCVMPVDNTLIGHECSNMEGSLQSIWPRGTPSLSRQILPSANQQKEKPCLQPLNQKRNLPFSPSTKEQCPRGRPLLPPLRTQT